MRFQTIWQTPVLEQLADVWLHAPDRSAVTAATARVDQLLQADPVHVGESREGANRVVFVDPLVVHYMVVLDDQKVLILDVQHV
jgi:hypothetical protein